MAITFGGASLSCELFSAVLSGTPEDVRWALARGADPAAAGSQALCLATERGCHECVEILIPGSNPLVDNCLPLRQAAERGHASCVRELLPVSNASGAWAALFLASGAGHAECVKLLLGACDPLRESSAALLWAAANGHAECVKLLLPVSDPLANAGQAFAKAASNGHADVIIAMLEHGADYARCCDLAGEIRKATLFGRPRVAGAILAHVESLALVGALPAEFSGAPSPAPRL